MMKSIVIFLLLVSPIANADDPVVLSANESPPYWSKKSLYNGFGGEIIDAISKAGGVESMIEFKPLKRLIEDTTDNDLGNPVFYMDNQDFAAIIPIAISQVSLYYYDPTHDKKVQFNSLKDLRGFRLGALSGTVTNRTMFEQMGITFETSYSQESLFKKLQHGRLDFVLELDLVGQQTIAKNFPTERKYFVAIPLPKSVSPIAIMLDKNYPDVENIAQRYREGLAKIIKNGRYAEILNLRYYPQPPPALWFKELDRFTHLYQTSP